MRKPERLVGYINIYENSFPFEFDENNFEILIYPDKETKRKNNSLRELFSYNCKEHKWINDINLFGITSEGNNIIFNVLDNKNSYNGFTSYEANWFYIFSREASYEKIDGFKLSGDIINYFYSPRIALEQKISFEDDNSSTISVASSKQQNAKCGKYRIGKNIDLTISTEAFALASFPSYSNPIYAKSQMVFSFSKPADIAILLKAYNNAICFLEYVSYRENVGINTADIFCYNEKGLRKDCGLLVYNDNNDLETNKNVSKRIITQEILKTKTASIFTAIKNNKLGFQHICESIDKTTYYPSSRIIMIFAEFEREFRNIYGTNVNRSDKYLNIKNEVIDIVNELVSKKTSKEKRYVKQFKKLIENSDNSFASNVEYALKDCKTIISVFTEKYYDDSFEKIVDDISNRMGALRNGIAHSRLDLELDAIHLSDVHIMEELLYIIRLKKMNISEQKIKEAINSLFDENFHF